MLEDRLGFTLAFGASLAGMSVLAAVPIVERAIVDNTIVKHSESVVPLLILLVLMGTTTFGAGFVRRYFGGRLAFATQYRLRTDIFEHLQRLDFARQDELQTGQLVSRANSDVGIIQGLLSFLPILMGNLLMTIISVVVMFFVYWPLALLVTATLPTLLFISIRLRSKVFPASWDSQQREGEVTVTVEEAVTGIRIVKGFSQESQMVSELRDRAARLFSSRVRTIKIQSKLQAVLQGVPLVAQAFIIGLGGLAAYDHKLSLGSFLLFSSYVAALSDPVRQMATLVTVSEQARAGAERIFDLLDANPLVVEPETPIVDWARRGQVSLEGVSFGYRKGESVVEEMDLEIGSNETVAIVGRSGSGKSTLALLLPRFYDVSSGRISIDGIDIREMSLASLRSTVGVVFEESFLFSDTIFRNIAMSDPEVDFELVRRAAVAAGADKFISEFRDGYQTVVGERGLSLSGGQRQRVALARALLSSPDVLILDDATSAVDAETEAEIHSALAQFGRTKTLILIAHRRSTLTLASRIVVLDGGRIVDQGTHQELSSRCSLYRTLIGGKTDMLSEVEETVGAESLSTQIAGGQKSFADRATAIPRTRGMGPGGSLLAPTKSLMEALKRLPPATEVPQMDLGAFNVAKPVNYSFLSGLRSVRRGLSMGALLIGMDAVLGLAGPLILRSSIDGGIQHKELSLILFGGLAMGLVALVDTLVVWREGIVTGRTSERFLYQLRSRIFERMMFLGMDYYESEMAGRIMTRMTSDVDAFSELIQTGLVGALVSLVSFLGVLVILLGLSPQLTLGALATMPILLLATYLFQRYSARAYERAREKIAVVNANFQEGVAGLKVTQSFRREDAKSSTFRSVSAEYRDARMGAQRLVAAYFPFVGFLSDLAAAIVLGVGRGLVLSGALTIGTVLAFVLYVGRIFAPIQQLSQTFDQVQQVRVASKQIARLMSISTNVPQAVEPELPRGQAVGRIRFRSVSFRYPGSAEPALQSLDLDIPAGSRIALVGETGAGKSTIAKLLARFYDPNDGSVELDGVDLRDYDLGWLRRQVGYLPQEPFLFAGSISRNVSFARPDATDAEVVEACRQVGVLEFASKLTDGIETELGERGQGLSLGQRQLVVLARLYLAAPRVLVMDEASSSLDLAAEAMVQEALEKLSSGRTTLIIAHRLATAVSSDLIVVVHGGRAVEMGSHFELLAADGPYARLWGLSEVDRAV